MEKSIRRIENLHILLWLIKDTCWVMDAKVPGMLMVVPTVMVAIYITWISRSNKSELFHNLAVTCWILANSTWMMGEFFFDDSLRTPAKVFFGLGLLFVGWYYVKHHPFQPKSDSKNINT